MYEASCSLCSQGSEALLSITTVMLSLFSQVQEHDYVKPSCSLCSHRFRNMISLFLQVQKHDYFYEASHSLCFFHVVSSNCINKPLSSLCFHRSSVCSVSTMYVRTAPATKVTTKSTSVTFATDRSKTLFFLFIHYLY